jgi:hypothetical protein
LLRRAEPGRVFHGAAGFLLDKPVDVGKLAVVDLCDLLSVGATSLDASKCGLVVDKLVTPPRHRAAYGRIILSGANTNPIESCVAFDYGVV